MNEGLDDLWLAHGSGLLPIAHFELHHGIDCLL